MENEEFDSIIRQKVGEYEKSPEIVRLPDFRSVKQKMNRNTYGLLLKVAASVAILLLAGTYFYTNKVTRPTNGNVKTYSVKPIIPEEVAELTKPKILLEKNIDTPKRVVNQTKPILLLSKNPAQEESILADDEDTNFLVQTTDSVPLTVEIIPIRRDYNTSKTIRFKPHSQIVITDTLSEKRNRLFQTPSLFNLKKMRYEN